MNLEQRRTLEIRILSSIVMKFSVQAFEQALAEKGITLSMLQFGIMRLVSHHPYTLSELSRKMHLDPSTLVPSIDALEKKGFVERRRDPEDRRRMPLYITEQAHNLMRETHMISEGDPLMGALDTIGETNAELLRRLLREVVENMPGGSDILQEIEARINPSCTDQSISQEELLD